MFKSVKNRMTFSNFGDDSLVVWLDGFLVDRQSSGKARRTIEFYQDKIIGFVSFCEKRSVSNISQITPTLIREYLLWLADTNHTPGGVHAFYRALRAFLRWYEDEAEPDNWRNPIKKVKAPKVPVEPLEPVSFEVVDALYNACRHGTLADARDRAIFLFLLDTGVRAGELLALNVEDVGVMGDILVRKGKGSKPRTVFIGKRSRRLLRKYMKLRHDRNKALWIGARTKTPNRLTYRGLRTMLRRRAAMAKVKPPSLHAFRRAFAITMLRAGTDVFTLAKLMGHADISVLQRYLLQTTKDTEKAFRRASPVDNAW